MINNKDRTITVKLTKRGEDEMIREHQGKQMGRERILGSEVGDKKREGTEGREIEGQESLMREKEEKDAEGKGKDKTMKGMR